MDQEALIVSVIEGVRKERGMSIAELARRSAIDRKRLWYILRHKRALHAGELVRLAVVLNLGLQHFLTLDQARTLQKHREEILHDYGFSSEVARILRRDPEACSETAEQS